MTLILTINGPETIWLLADRRLSAKGRRPKDDARKIMLLETRDGVAILGYAGLGATVAGTEPADWMSSVLRGRNAPLEQSLSMLASALQKQFPRHLLRLPGSVPAAHNVLIPAFLEDSARLYSIDMLFSPDRRSYKFRYTRHVVGGANGALTNRTPRIALAGSGLTYLNGKRAWARELIHLVRACDAKKISHNAVADHLAAINFRVHQGTTDASVGPRCIVAWRNRKNGVHKGGGGQRYYSGTSLDSDAPMLPTIATGTDLRAFIGVVGPHIFKGMPKPGQDPTTALPIDVDTINAELARLPEKPDENLR